MEFDTFSFFCIFIVVIFAIVMVFIVVYYMEIVTNRSANNVTEQETIENKSPLNNIPAKEPDQFKNCNCEQSVKTAHLCAVQHKLSCPIFWKLNPGKTKEQFLRHEGFLTDS